MLFTMYGGSLREIVHWRMGGDSNPRCLSAHTLSRRAQSTALSPIQKNRPLPLNLILVGQRQSKQSKTKRKRQRKIITTVGAGTIRREVVGCRCKIHQSRRTRRSLGRSAFCKRWLLSEMCRGRKGSHPILRRRDRSNR